MLQVNRVSKRFGPRVILDQVLLNLAEGEHSALVGDNGSGKTTLLEIITGRLEPDSGTVILAQQETLGYLPQNPRLNQSGTLGESLAKTLAQVDSRAHPAGLIPAQEAQALRILSGLGLGYLSLNTPTQILSGGESTRVSLAGLLLTRPEILLLDEPTNHLDIPALQWLEGFIQTYRGSVLMVSHDRVFLDRTISCVYELNDLTHTITKFPGNYSHYAEIKENERQKAYETWKDQQEEIQRLKTDWVHTAEQARWTEQKTNDSTIRRYAKKVARKANAKKKRLERFLDSSERLEKPMDKWRLRVNFVDPAHQSAILMRAEGLSFAYDEKPVFDQLDLVLKQSERVALIGHNGCGKTTLLKVLIGQLQPQCGSIKWSPSLNLGYMSQMQDDLEPNITPLELIQKTGNMDLSEVYHFLHYFLIDADHTNLPCAALSLGQRARLHLAKLVAEGANFLVLDEPINHLDIPSRLQFEKALEAFNGGVLLVAHDRAFISRVTQKTWLLQQGRILEGWSADLSSEN